MILVTGGTGFVGRNLMNELIRKAYTIRCLGRDPLKAKGLPSGALFSRGDVSDPSSLVSAMEGVDAVIHLVGILVETKGATFTRVHVDGTRNVVEACRKTGVKRYLHISALGTRKDARSAYHKSKWEAEEIVRSSGLEYTIFRPSVMFGAEDRFTNTFASLMRLFPIVAVPGNGQNRMQPVFVKDLARAVAEAIGMADTLGKTYEVAGPEALTFDEILENIALAIGKKRALLHVPMPIMRTGALFMEAVLSKPPLTRDALLMLEEDNVTDKNALQTTFGMTLTGFVEGMRTYLH